MHAFSRWNSCSQAPRSTWRAQGRVGCAQKVTGPVSTRSPGFPAFSRSPLANAPLGARAAHRCRMCLPARVIVVGHCTRTRKGEHQPTGTRPTPQRTHPRVRNGRVLVPLSDTLTLPSTAQDTFDPLTSVEQVASPRLMALVKRSRAGRDIHDVPTASLSQSLGRCRRKPAPRDGACDAVGWLLGADRASRDRKSRARLN